METVKQATRFAEALGEGCRVHRAESEQVEIDFSEPAAQKLLKTLGARPAPAKELPSASCWTGYERSCMSLSRRIRRALGVGYAGYITAGHRDFWPENYNPECAARVQFTEQEIRQAADKLEEAQKEPASALADIITG